MIPTDYEYLIPQAFPEYQAGLRQILRDPQTQIIQEPIDICKILKVTKSSHIVYVQYSTEVPQLDQDFFVNNDNNQHIRFSLNLEITMMFYKPLVVDNNFVAFPNYLYDHRKTAFNKHIQLPIELQNAMIL